MYFRRSCREVARLLTLREERPWGWRERIAVKLHMQICKACPRVERQLELMRAAMGRWRSYAGEEPQGRQ
jgi:hypothetical protein